MYNVHTSFSHIFSKKCVFLIKVEKNCNFQSITFLKDNNEIKMLWKKNGKSIEKQWKFNGLYSGKSMEYTLKSARKKLIEIE